MSFRTPALRYTVCDSYVFPYTRAKVRSSWLICTVCDSHAEFVTHMQSFWHIFRWFVTYHGILPSRVHGMSRYVTNPMLSHELCISSLLETHTYINRTTGPCRLMYALKGTLNIMPRYVTNSVYESQTPYPFYVCDAHTYKLDYRPLRAAVCLRGTIHIMPRYVTNSAYESRTLYPFYVWDAHL